MPNDVNYGVTLKLPEAFYIRYGGIDEEHEHLVTLANGCLAQCVDTELCEFEPCLQTFVDCMRSHFENEERLMAGVHFPELARHAAHHRDCLAQVEAIRDDCRRAGRVSRDAIIRCFDQVISDAAKADLKFAEFLDGQGVLPPREAS